MYTPIGQTGIIGVLSVNRNEIYPPKALPKELINVMHVPYVIQDAVFPHTILLLGQRIHERQLYKQIIVAENINQWRFMRDNFTKYCVISVEAACNKEYLENNVLESNFIPKHLVDEIKKVY